MVATTGAAAVVSTGVGVVSWTGAWVVTGASGVGVGVGVSTTGSGVGVGIDVVTSTTLVSMKTPWVDAGATGSGVVEVTTGGVEVVVGTTLLELI